jgi:hypothetical protein
VDSVYKGSHNPVDWHVVTKDGDIFDYEPSLKVRNHSPTGFSFGYRGSGPAQLALALLLEVTDRGTAEKLYHDFMSDVVARFPERGEWELTSNQILQWVKEKTDGAKNS